MWHRAILTSLVAAALLAACSPKAEKPPVSGADLVATAVAAHYGVRVDAVVPNGSRFDWSVTAANNSEYGWKGTLTVKLVDAANIILESHDFPIAEMVPPGGTTGGLTFNSAFAPVERGGKVARLKVEVNVADYVEPPAAGK